MENVLAILLAGGAGERLYPLTRDTAKPAVPFGGAYRIIDFTLSNCINSDLRRILVLTQYKSLDLIRHLRDGWNILSAELGEYIEVLPPMKRVSEDGGTRGPPTRSSRISKALRRKRPISH
jgi:glucose-1-phosphate adenylyltransferase